MLNRCMFNKLWNARHPLLVTRLRQVALGSLGFSEATESTYLGKGISPATTNTSSPLTSTTPSTSSPTSSPPYSVSQLSRATTLSISPSMKMDLQIRPRLFSASLTRLHGVSVCISQSVLLCAPVARSTTLIEYLAEVRNAVFVPLHELRDSENEYFDTIIFTNDILR